MNYSILKQQTQFYIVYAINCTKNNKNLNKLLRKKLNQTYDLRTNANT